MEGRIFPAFFRNDFRKEQIGSFRKAGKKGGIAIGYRFINLLSQTMLHTFDFTIGDVPVSGKAACFFCHRFASFPVDSLKLPKYFIVIDLF